MKFSATPRFPLYASLITVCDTFDDLREKLTSFGNEFFTFKIINYNIQSLRYIWNHHEFSTRGKGVKFSSYDSLTISPIVALCARVWYLCADVALTWIIGNCAREKISVRNRTSCGGKEIRGDKERRKACGKRERRVILAGILKERNPFQGDA